MLNNFAGSSEEVRASWDFSKRVGAASDSGTPNARATTPSSQELDMYPPQMQNPIRTLLGLIKLHIVLISSFEPGGGYIWRGCIVTPNQESSHS